VVSFSAVGAAVGASRESLAKRKNNHLAFWVFSTFVRSIHPSRTFGIVSFRQFSVTEKAFARKKNKENRAIRNFPSELAF